MQVLDSIPSNRSALAGPAQLYAELWVSLASLLRSYTAAHGLNKKQQATVELDEKHILVRVAERWLKLDIVGEDIRWIRENGTAGELSFTAHGTLTDREAHEEEMDMQAEAWARELMQ